MYIQPRSNSYQRWLNLALAPSAWWLLCSSSPPIQTAHGIRLRLVSLVSVFRYPHQWLSPLTTPAAQNGIHIICIPHTTSPHGPKSKQSMTSIKRIPERLCAEYMLRSIQSLGQSLLNESTITVSLLALWYRNAPPNNTRHMPWICGLCGSPSWSERWWCLRWIATHWRVTIPVVSQSQARIKWLTAGWNCTARCVWPRCR
jgi:hypothetical protein